MHEQLEANLLSLRGANYWDDLAVYNNSQMTRDMTRVEDGDNHDVTDIITKHVYQKMNGKIRQWFDRGLSFSILYDARE